MPITLKKNSKQVKATTAREKVETIIAPTQQDHDEKFTYEDLQLLVDAYRDETDELGDAKLTTVDGCIALTIMDKSETNITVYYAANTPEIYTLIDAKYLKLIDSDRAVYNDYWDRWEAVLDVLGPCKIIDETFFE